MAIIPLSRGMVAIVDDDDFTRLSAYRWHARPATSSFEENWYACRTYGRGSPIYMHREIVGAGTGEQVDHRNHDGLDNRKANLRICSPGQNALNSRRARSGTGYRGVHPSKNGRRFRARIRTNTKNISLGVFDSAAEAARVRDRAALELFGEFAILNFPQAERRS